MRTVCCERSVRGIIAILRVFKVNRMPPSMILNMFARSSITESDDITPARSSAVAYKWEFLGTTIICWRSQSAGSKTKANNQPANGHP
eukprot:1490214-Karenia_brevis.AAC.1